MNNPGSHIRDEERIIQLLKNSKVEGLSLLYDRYAPMLFGIILRILPDRETAEEALQDTFLKVWKSAASYEPAKGTLPVWIVRIARNTAIDRRRLRSFGQQQKTSGEEMERLAEREGERDFNPDTIGIRESTANLPDEQRALIDLIYFNGFTHTEAAEELNIPLGTVKSRLRLAVSALRKLLS